MHEHSSLSILSVPSPPVEETHSTEMGQELEHLSAELLDLTANDPNTPLFNQYFSEDFIMRVENVIWFKGRDEQLEMVQSAASGRPSYSLKSFATCSSYDDVRKTAVVWVSVRLRGFFFQDMRIEEVVRCAWARKQGVWKCENMNFAVGGSYLDT